MNCVNCNEKLMDDEIKWAYDEPYCEECFDNRYTYCTSCDAVITRDNAMYNDSDEPYCEDCYVDDNDPDCPDNPDVDEMDRKHIINLSRNWLKGEIENRRPIYINKNDFKLKVIREKAGLVEDPIYVFGLKEKDEHLISASPNLIDDVKEIIPFYLPCVRVLEGYGINRLGISYSLRRNNLKEVVNLIKALTSIKVPA